MVSVRDAFIFYAVLSIIISIIGMIIGYFGYYVFNDNLDKFENGMIGAGYGVVIGVIISTILYVIFKNKLEY
jgi:hypothetical protein